MQMIPQNHGIGDHATSRNLSLEESNYKRMDEEGNPVEETDADEDMSSSYENPVGK